MNTKRRERRGDHGHQRLRRRYPNATLDAASTLRHWTDGFGHPVWLVAGWDTRVHRVTACIAYLLLDLGQAVDYALLLSKAAQAPATGP